MLLFTDRRVYDEVNTLFQKKINMRIKKVLSIFNETVHCWNEDNISSFAAAFAFYILFSIAPLIYICSTMSQVVLSNASMQEYIFSQVEQLLGHESALQLQAMLQGINIYDQNITHIIIGVILIFFGATSLFIQVKVSLDAIWKVEYKPSKGVMELIKTRILAFVLVIVLSVFLFMSLIANISMSILNSHLSSFYFGSLRFGIIVEFIVSFAMLTTFIAIIFKVLPDIKLQWKDVWLGALLSTSLFTIGKIILSFYFSHIFVIKTYSASSGIVILLIWVYYIAQIFFLGAAFTKVYTRRNG